MTIWPYGHKALGTTIFSTSGKQFQVPIIVHALSRWADSGGLQSGGTMGENPTMKIEQLCTLSSNTIYDVYIMYIYIFTTHIP